jgi:hypothetical protein
MGRCEDNAVGMEFGREAFAGNGPALDMTVVFCPYLAVGAKSEVFGYAILDIVVFVVPVVFGAYGGEGEGCGEAMEDSSREMHIDQSMEYLKDVF